MSFQSEPSSSSPQRSEWIDLAKAVSLLGVLLYHALSMRAIGWEGLKAFQTWEWAAIVLLPVRLPVFFFISGLLASKLLQRSDADGVQKRAGNLLRVYGIWGLILLIVMEPFNGMQLSAASLLQTSVGLSLAWYLWALPVFLLLTWHSRRISAYLLIPLVLAAAMVFVPPTGASIHQGMLRCLPFFLVGARLPQVGTLLARNPSARKAAAFTLPFLVLTIVSQTQPVPLTILDMAGIAAAIPCFALIAHRSSAAVAFGRWFGARTLPIYVIHFPLFSVAGYAVSHWLAPAPTNMPWLIAVYPLLLTACGMAASLAVYAAILRCGGGWAFGFESPARDQAFRKALQGAS